MRETNLGLIVAVFDDDEQAHSAYHDLKIARKQHLFEIQDVAIIWRDEEGHLHTKEASDPGGGKGAAAGGVFGAILGLIGGPAGLVTGAAAGAIVGGVAAKIIDSGIPDDRLRHIGKGLSPGVFAIIGIVEHQWLNDVQRTLKESGAAVLTERLHLGLTEKQDIEE